MFVVVVVTGVVDKVVSEVVAEIVQGLLAIELKSNWYVTPVF